MVVGSNGWFFDQITRAGSVVDNRTVYEAPANLELLEAAVYFLAGQDERIAQSASGRTMPTIRPMTGSEIGMMRWLLAAGLPGVILLLGVLHRILRG